MIPALAVSHFIDESNFRLFDQIKALEYRKQQSVFHNDMDCLFHSDYGIVQYGVTDYFGSISKYLRENKVKMFSLDLGPAAEQVKLENYYYMPLSRLLSKTELHEIIKSRLAYMKQNFEGYIALENLNFFPTFAYNYICDANFISEVVRNNDVHFILDIAHAIITACNMGVDKYKYLSSLPLERIKGIHLSAPGLKEGQWRDLHEAPSEEEYELLAFVEKHIEEEFYLVVEYYDDFAKLEEIYKNLSDKFLVNK